MKIFEYRMPIRKEIPEPVEECNSCTRIKFNPASKKKIDIAGKFSTMGFPLIKLFNKLPKTGTERNTSLRNGRVSV